MSLLICHQHPWAARLKLGIERCRTSYDERPRGNLRPERISWHWKAQIDLLLQEVHITSRSPYEFLKCINLEHVRTNHKEIASRSTCWEVALYYHWLVVRNIFYVSLHWDFHHPNWRSHVSEGGLNHQSDHQSHHHRRITAIITRTIIRRITTNQITTIITT